MNYPLPDYLESVPVLENRWQLLAEATSAAPEGLWAEFGVARGKSADFLTSRLTSDGSLDLFDSFQGLPYAWERTDGIFAKGLFACRVYEPKAPNVNVHVGLFSETLPGFYAPNTLAFAHIDCDLYESTKDVLEHVSDALMPGAIVVFDELFGFGGWEQFEHRAVTEWSLNREWVYRDSEYRAMMRVIK